jgi:hypothetical protein
MLVHAIRGPGPTAQVGLLALTLAACSGGADRAVPDETPLWSVASEPILAVGEQDGDPRYLFDRVRAVRLLEAGGVVVANGGDGGIRTYDAAGAHVISVGGPGEGPGEFASIGYLAILEPDTILAYDGSLYRATRFLLDGTLIDERPMRAEDGAPEMYFGTFSNGDAAIATLVPGARGGTGIVPDRMVVGRYGPDGRRGAELGTFEGIRRPGGGGVVPFTPYPHGLLLGDSLLYTDGLAPHLTVLGGDGAAAGSLVVPVPVPEPTAAWDRLRSVLQERDEMNRLEFVAAGAEAEPVPAIAEVMLDADDRIWVKHYDPATDNALLFSTFPANGGRWTIVRGDGSVVAEVELPDGFAPFDARGRSVAGVRQDELGVERVVVLALQG